MMLIRHTVKLFSVSLVAIGAFLGLITASLTVDWLLFGDAYALVSAIVWATLTGAVFGTRAVVNNVANGGD
ncbi:hypothetical protein M196_gp67 [Halorubrum tailed virus 4]|uniref:Uncharacterized protein n=1 Tax=Halorubrum tailed virus 4 TaxID=1273752 RepID=R4T655_9CAUD|nr:hypothetical protein M196_gp67 [Halorubrum tailed virus 4]AGM11159.1 hypothetical protein HRTV4_67 [Halorubrum tailed virus 4]